MVTATPSQLIRQQMTEPSRPPLAWPAEALLTDPNGQPLTWADLPGPPEDGWLALGEIDEPAVLLVYYFGQGGREVMLELQDRTVRTLLDTRWEGDRRVWWLHLRD